MAHHHGHDHGVGARTDARPLAVALALILAFMALEVVLGIVANSLALLSDAAHMLVDAAALGLSVWAARLALRPPGGWMTFGFRRAEILSAQVNGATMLVLGLLIVAEGVHRLIDPPDVRAPIVVATAVVGAVVNVVALRQVARANRANLNVEGSYRHLLTDLYAFAGTALAGIVVWTTGFERADPIASLAVAASMLAAAWPLLRSSGRVDAFASTAIARWSANRCRLGRPVTGSRVSGWAGGARPSRTSTSPYGLGMLSSSGGDASIIRRASARRRARCVACMPADTI